MTEDLDDTDEMPAWTEPELRLPAGSSSLAEVELAALSHRGRVRTNNEDHFCVARFDRSMRTLASNLAEGDVPRHYSETVYGLLVADGVGGAAAGEIASRTAIHALVDLVIDTPDWIMRLDQPLAAEVMQRMERRFQQVREVLVEKARKDPSLRGMATTMTVAASLGPELITAHVGDSRAYILRSSGRLERLTRDQTLAQSLADSGAISQADIATHPARNVLTSALATRGAFVQVELNRWMLESGDQLLLCSDGLNDMVADDVIAGALAAPGTAGAACRRLIDLALDAGGRDNVTVVVARYHFPRGEPRPPEPPRAG